MDSPSAPSPAPSAPSSPFVRDFARPLSASMYTGYSSGSTSLGSVLHCVTHSRIYCDIKDHAKNTKPSPCFTVIRVVQPGWCYSPWKKPKAGTKGTRGSDSKPLFEVGRKEQDGPISVITSLKMFQFEREGKFDKGPRVDESVCELQVGLTLRYNVQAFSYEEKKGVGSLFPSDIEFIPEYSVVELVVVPGAVDAARPGYGLKFQTIRLVPQSLYSYLSPLGLALLPSTCDASSELTTRLQAENAGIKAMVETIAHVFFAKVF